MSEIEQLERLAPREYAQPGYETLLEELDSSSQGVVLADRYWQVCGIDLAYNDALHRFIVRKIADGVRAEGSDLEFFRRAAALFMHIGDLSLEQVVAYDKRQIVTLRMPGTELEQLTS